MEILIDHLTRMAAGYICAAGLAADGRHIRPVLDGSRLPDSLLEGQGGPLAVGAVVDIGHTEPVGMRPEIEDHRVRLASLKKVGVAQPQALWSSLENDAQLALVDIFGHDLQNRRRGAVVPIGAGRASLGTFAPGYRPRLYEGDGRLRCEITDPDLGQLDLSVTAVALHRKTVHGWVPDKQTADKINESIRNDEEILVSVGLGRPWPKSDPAHWLQVNSIHIRRPSTPSRAPAAFDLNRTQEEHPNAYARWTKPEEEQLERMFHEGMKTSELATELGRQPGGIRSRLRRLGLIR